MILQKNQINERYYWDAPDDFTWTGINHKNLKYRLLSIMHIFCDAPFYGIYRENGKRYTIITNIRFANDNRELDDIPTLKGIRNVELVAYTNKNERLDVRIDNGNVGEETKTVHFDNFSESEQKLIYDILIKRWRNATKDVFMLSNEL